MGGRVKWACGVTGVALWGQGSAVHVGTRVPQRRCISGESRMRRLVRALVVPQVRE